MYKSINLKTILNNCRILENLVSPEFEDYLRGDEFPYVGGGGGGSIDPSQGGGGTGGGTAGTTSSNILPSLSISPSTNQSIVTGGTLCITASGSISLPLESEAPTSFDGGCSASSGGTWTKTCGTNNAYDGEAFDTKLIYKQRPWQITGRNSSLASSTSPLNMQLLLGVRTTG